MVDMLHNVLRLLEKAIESGFLEQSRGTDGGVDHTSEIPGGDVISRG